MTFSKSSSPRKSESSSDATQALSGFSDALNKFVQELADTAGIFRFSKHHAQGNEFYIALTDSPENIPQNLVALLEASSKETLQERTGEDSLRLGINDSFGADGLIFSAPTNSGESAGKPGKKSGGEADLKDGQETSEEKSEQESENANYKMVLFNADGSRAEISGNGIRCLCQALAQNSQIPAADYLIHTDAGPRAARIKDGLAEISFAETEMGAVVNLEANTPATKAAAKSVAGNIASLQNISPAENTDTQIPVEALNPETDLEMSSEILNTCFVDLGNPHLVIQITDAAAITTAELEKLSRQVMADSVAAGLGELNIEFVSVPAPATVPTPDLASSDTQPLSRIVMKVYERGVGVTQACGSGAVASFAALRHLNIITAKKATVQMDGGAAEVSVDASSEEEREQEGTEREGERVEIYRLGGPVNFVELLLGDQNL